MGVLGISARKFFVATSLILLAGCSGLSPLSLLSGGGPNVAANVQAGAENNQNIGASQRNEQTISDVVTDTIRQSADKNKINTETVDSITVNEVEPWILILLVLGWLLPSPAEMGRWIKNLFHK